ncbi:hypothetical protein C8F01DRAFT_1245304 [Mycena amicta]|nr:hypothetical protein C8F01DRAFT_1245304 [Mycena amicta]
MSTDVDHRKEARLLELINGVSNGISIPGVCLCVVLLIAVAVLHWNSASRPHLNRVSFRLLIYALVSNVIFGLTVFIPMTEHNHACSFIGFLGVVGPMFSGCMFCCMELNLQLVLVWGLNGSKLRLERYYLLGTLFLCAACNIPTWIAGKLGWYAISGVCWLSDPSPETQVHWLIGTHSVWMLLMALTELLSFVLLVGFMIRIGTLRAQASAAAAQSRLETTTSFGSITSSSLPKPPILRYRRMIIRIGLYPLLACFLSVTACICDVYATLHPEATDYKDKILLLDFFAYSLRPLLYGLLTATDPAFIRALRAFRLPPLFTVGNPNAQSQSPSPHPNPPSLSLRLPMGSLSTFPPLTPPATTYRSSVSFLPSPRPSDSRVRRSLSVSASLHRETSALAPIRLSITADSTQTQTHIVPALLSVPGPSPPSESISYPPEDYKGEHRDKNSGLPLHRASEERERRRTTTRFSLETRPRDDAGGGLEDEGEEQDDSIMHQI